MTILEEETKSAKRAAREAAADGSQEPVGNGKGKARELVVEEVWKPSGAIISFWEAAGIEYVPDLICPHALTNVDQ
jgi:translation initiation factor 2D